MCKLLFPVVFFCPQSESDCVQIAYNAEVKIKLHFTPLTTCFQLVVKSHTLPTCASTCTHTHIVSLFLLLFILSSKQKKTWIYRDGLLCLLINTVWHIQLRHQPGVCFEMKDATCQFDKSINRTFKIPHGFILQHHYIQIIMLRNETNLLWCRSIQYLYMRTSCV